jgi:hypothetical protein
MDLKLILVYGICMCFSACMLFRTQGENDMMFQPCALQDSLCIARAIENLDTANVPEYIIFVNLHYVAHPEIGNFYRGVAGDQNPANGLFWSDLFINHVNYQLDSLGTSKTSLKNFQGRARYKIALYTNPANSKDSFGGIWFWDSGFRFNFPYGDTVLNIIFKNDPHRKLNGAACGLTMCHYMHLYGAYDNVINKGKFGWWSFAGLFNHELGHLMGLCHSFYCGNPCNEIDLLVQKECKLADCFDDCGGPNQGICNNWDSGSANMMGYNPDQNALTPCQWKHIMHTLYTSKAHYVLKKQSGRFVPH